MKTNTKSEIQSESNKIIKEKGKGKDALAAMESLKTIT